MAKTKTEERKKEKKEKKRSDSEGVSKPKKDKKEKKSSDASLSKALTDHLDDLANEDDAVVSDPTGSTVAMVDVQGDGSAKKPLLAAMVPFANPLSDEKQGKKVLKGVKKSAKNKTLKRGVKEVVKALRKSPLATTDPSATPVGVVVLAADISPMDVISHIPVLCEDHGIPYIYVPSRAELGAAGATKRPTSVVMVSGEKKAAKEGKKDEGDDAAEWQEAYNDLVKVVVKAGKDVKV